jgi:Spy/CpxP family protein refolding chaperone
MTSNLKKWLLGAALAAAGVMSVGSWAMGPPPEGMQQPDPVRMMTHMSKQLNLTEEQKAKIESLQAKAKQAVAADQKRMQELRTEMMGMRDNFDATKARKTADEIGQVTGRLVFQASETWSQVYQVLNAEQKAKLESLMAQRDERRAKWREGGEKPSK